MAADCLYSGYSPRGLAYEGDYLTGLRRGDCTICLMLRRLPVLRIHPNTIPGEYKYLTDSLKGGG